MLLLMIVFCVLILLWTVGAIIHNRPPNPTPPTPIGGSHVT